MSIIYKGNNCTLLDHRDYINKMYQRVSNVGDCLSPHELSRTLFSIQNSKKEVNRKRTRDSDELHEETTKVQQMYETFLDKLPTDLKTTFSSKQSLPITSDVRDLSKDLFEKTVFEHAGISGGNNSHVALKCKIKEEEFLIPSKSRFMCGSVHDQCLKLEGNNFDFIIADPPWWNKYIRRLKSANDKLSYSMMYNEDIASIPIKKLLSHNCLVAVWCTNAPNNIEAVKNLIFPQWDVTYLTTWYWLKVTVDLQPLCPFGSGYKKQPFERLILGKVGDIREVPACQLIVSVPSALHSHKPPLLDLLTPYVKVKHPQTLELFARYLLPNTTSVGFEPLKWQHTSLFK